MALPHIQLVQGKAPSKRKQAFERLMQRFGNFLMNSWVTILTTLMGILVAIALAIPVLSYLGLDSIAKPLFFAMHMVCAQIPSHSFYMFGHQLGLCARNISIYGSMFLGSLLFDLSKKRIPGIPWWLWILLILPMAWDGGTQLFGWRESNWELRVLTGTLFGLSTVWFVLPLIHKTLLETPAPVPVQHYGQRMRIYPQQVTNASNGSTTAVTSHLTASTLPGNAHNEQ